MSNKNFTNKHHQTNKTHGNCFESKHRSTILHQAEAGKDECGKISENEKIKNLDLTELATILKIKMIEEEGLFKTVLKSKLSQCCSQWAFENGLKQ